VILNTKVYSETTQKLKIDQHEPPINNGADLICAAIETTSSGISYQRRDIHSICMFARMLLYINGKFKVKQI
jgi:hypothetical protein